MITAQLKAIALALTISLAGFAFVLSKVQPEIPAVDSAEIENGRILAFLHEYRKWTKINKQPIVVASDLAAVGG